MADSGLSKERLETGQYYVSYIVVQAVKSLENRTSSRDASPIKAYLQDKLSFQVSLRMKWPEDSAQREYVAVIHRAFAQSENSR